MIYSLIYFINSWVWQSQSTLCNVEKVHHLKIKNRWAWHQCLQWFTNNARLCIIYQVTSPFFIFANEKWLLKSEYQTQLWVSVPFLMDFSFNSLIFLIFLFFNFVFLSIVYHFLPVFSVLATTFFQRGAGLTNESQGLKKKTKKPVNTL